MMTSSITLNPASVTAPRALESPWEVLMRRWTGVPAEADATTANTEQSVRQMMRKFRITSIPWKELIYAELGN